MKKYYSFMVSAFLMTILMLLPACNIEQEPHQTAIDVFQSPTATFLPPTKSSDIITPEEKLDLATQTVPAPSATVMLATPKPTLTLTPVFTSTPTSTDIFLQGPLVVYHIQNDESYLLLFDLGTLTIRQLKPDDLDYFSGLSWMNGGCNLYLGGLIIDLQGNIVDKIVDFEDDSDPFKINKLSPDKNWGAIDIFSGEYTEKGLEVLTLEILSRTDPTFRLQLAPNGGATAYNWSPNGEWLAFTDYDENGILQVYQATPNHQAVVQLTHHTTSLGSINDIVWSPDGENIAYAVTNLLTSSLPYEYQNKDEGWVGIVSTSNQNIRRITPEKYNYTRGMWWSSDGAQLAIIGDGLPLDNNDPLSTTQIHWADANDGTILKSFYASDAPSNGFSLGVAVGDTDSILFISGSKLYLLNASDMSYMEIPSSFETKGLIRDVLGAPFDFSGEAECLR